MKGILDAHTSRELGPHPAGPGKWADYTYVSPWNLSQQVVAPRQKWLTVRLGFRVPIVRFPDGALIMESSDVAKKLETCPGPSLRLDDDLQKKAQDISNQIIFPMVAFLFYRIYNDVITEEEKDWFRKDREGRAAIMLGRDKISLEDWEKEAGGKASFTNSEPGMAELSKFLKENKKDDGPFISGSEACYADLMVVGIARFFRQANDDAYEKLMESVEGLKELDEACSPWFQRNNY